VKPVPAPWGEGDITVGADAAHRIIDGALSGHAHEKPVLVSSGEESLVYGVAAMGDSLDNEKGLLAHEIARPSEIDERALVPEFLGQVSF
jgi:hypothetical protein